MYYRLRRNGEAAALARVVLLRVDANHPDLSADARRLAAVLDARNSSAASGGAAGDPRSRSSASGEWTAVEQAVRQRGVGAVFGHQDARHLVCDGDDDAQEVDDGVRLRAVHCHYVRGAV